MSIIRTFNKKAILTRIERIQKNTPMERLINAFLEKKDGEYHLDCRLWKGVSGSGTDTAITIHDSFEDAVHEFERMHELYPSDNDVILFVDDLNEEELIFMDGNAYKELLKDMADEDLEVLASGNAPVTEVKKIIKKGVSNNGCNNEI